MACAVEEIHVGDIGTTLVFAIQEKCVALDISSATTHTITLLRPDGSKVVLAAVFNTDGTDGLLKHLTLVTDLTVAGAYKVQALIVMGSGTHRSDIGSFEVFANL